MYKRKVCFGHSIRVGVIEEMHNKDDTRKGENEEVLVKEEIIWEFVQMGDLLYRTRG